MKRSTCLSAFLVGLSVTAMTSIASAAPTNNQAPKVVVQQAATQAGNMGSDVAQTDGSGTGTGTSTTPTTGTADGQQTGESGTSPQPAVSIGTSTTTPATDTSQSAAEAPAKKPKPRPFAGTQIYNQNSMTTATIFS